MSGTVQRLREWSRPGCQCARCSVCRDAADEIQGLTAALEQIADPLVLQVGPAVGMERALKIIAEMQSIARATLTSQQRGTE